MKQPVQIPYNPLLLKWARERIGISKATAAERLSIPVNEIDLLEEGRRLADLDTLKDLAKLYKRTLATLLLDEPPKEKPMPRDFRSVNSTEVGRFHDKTILAVRKARANAVSLLELRQEAGVTTPTFNIRSNISTNPEQVGDFIRAEWNLDEIRDINDPKLALEAFIEKFEEHGIAVFQLSLTQDNVRGFALVDEPFPIIGIKRGSEYVHSKIFTLFHELGHVLLNLSAISDTSSKATRIEEQWCNSLAAEILMPRELFLRHPYVLQNERNRNYEWPKKELIEIGQPFHSGPLAVLRRLLDFGRTTDHYYGEKHNLWNKPPMGRAKEPKGRELAKENLNEKGKTYVGLAFSLYDQNKLDIKELSDYLGVRMQYIAQTRQLLTT